LLLHWLDRDLGDNRDGIASDAQFNGPIDVCIDNNNNIIVVDCNRVSMIVKGNECLHDINCGGLFDST